MKVFYSDKMVADQGEQESLKGILKSPSSRKPAELAALLRSMDGIEFVEPKPLSIEDFKLAHDPGYVDGIFNLTVENGFGNKSPAIAATLPYTNGAMYDAAKAATPDMPTCALVAGFHHAGYAGWKNLGYFCTFNGLVISALKLIKDGKKGVAIIDADMHHGNGTDDILADYSGPIIHFSFGKFLHNPSHAEKYLDLLEQDGFIHALLKKERPEVILYQAGADVHVDDPYGGILRTDEIALRDLRMFHIAKDLGIPLAWNLAGGYQVAPDGSIQKVLDIHLGTFDSARDIYVDNQPEFRPDWYCAPGETIKGVMRERGITEAQLTEMLGRPAEYITGLLSGESILDREVAAKLAEKIGSTSGFWLRREARYRKDKARLSK